MELPGYIRDPQIVAAALFSFSLIVTAIQWIVPSAVAGELTMVVAPDTRYIYLPACQGPAAHFADRPLYLLYIGFIIPFCSVAALPVDTFVTMIVVQKLAYAVATALVFDTARRALNLRAGVVAGVSFALLFDSFRFTEWLLPDTIFTFVVALTLWTVILFYEDPSPRRRLALYAAIVWLVVTKPHGAPIVLGWLLYDIWAGGTERPKLAPSQRAGLGLLAIALFGIAVAGQDYIAFSYDLFRRGIVFSPPHDAPYPILYEYSPRPAPFSLAFIFVNLDHIAIIATMRASVFFIPVLDDVLKSEWKLFNSFWMTAMLVGTAIGIFRAYRHRFDLVRMWFTPLVAMVLVTAVTFVDASFRYRAAMAPVFSLFTAYAVEMTGLGDRLQHLLLPTREE